MFEHALVSEHEQRRHSDGASIASSFSYSGLFIEASSTFKLHICNSLPTSNILHATNGFFLYSTLNAIQLVLFYFWLFHRYLFAALSNDQLFIIVGVAGKKKKVDFYW